MHYQPELFREGYSPPAPQIQKPWWTTLVWLNLTAWIVGGFVGAVFVWWLLGELRP